MSGTLSTPNSGSPNSTEDPKVATAVSTLNGLLTASNLLDGAQLGAGTVPAVALASNSVTTAKITDANVTDTKLASPNNGVYKTLLSATGSMDGVASSSGTYLLGSAVSGGSAMAASGSALSATAAIRTPPLLDFDDADFTVAGFTQKLRLRAVIACNATAPGITFTFGLYPVTMSGSGGQITHTVGTVVSGSTLAMASPSASTPNRGTPTADFTVPADGAYVLGVALPSGIAANSVVSCTASLQTRNV